jgi:pimeloyl-ACP methyl ester carboxylesterase
MPSKTIDLGVRLHHLDEGSGDQTFVLVHGLGGSHLNWSPLIAPLAKRGRVLVPDLGGFGRTPPSTEGASVEANLALLARFVRAVAPDRRVVLVGNSMGGYLSLRMAADHGALVRALVLVDPAAPLPFGGRIDPTVAAMFASYMVPGVAQRLMRRRAAQVGAEGMVRDMMKMCTVDVARIDPAVIDAHIALARERASMPWAIDAFLEAARSVVLAITRRGTYHDAVDAVRAPTLLVHGARDRLVSVDAARALAKRRADWRYVEHHDLGHTPQLEAPGWLLGEMEPWLDALPAR